jgi:inosine-uridine nucleoside N-ribohydrolase
MADPLQLLTHGALALLIALGLLAASTSAAAGTRPVPVIFDTDMGNDIDDALALGIIHALQSRGECKLLAVTLTKENVHSAPYCDLVNTFYGRGDVPIGTVRNGPTPGEGNYTQAVATARDGGELRYPRTLLSGKDAPEATVLLRKTLAAQPDGTVVIIQVGFSTNMARLLDSAADEHSPLDGTALVKRKVRLLSVMAGSPKFPEFNVQRDIPAAQKLAAQWPTPILYSPFEVGKVIKFPAASIERDFNYVPHHPLAEAYRAYKKMPYDRETWDLTSVLVAIRPDHGYFDLSDPGTVTIDDKGLKHWRTHPEGRHRLLSVTPEQIIRAREAMVLLASQPPEE